MLLKTFLNPKYPSRDHALELPMAHEVTGLGDGHPNYDIIMDLFNNKVAYDETPDVSSSTSDDDKENILKQKVRELIENGALLHYDKSGLLLPTNIDCEEEE